MGGSIAGAKKQHIDNMEEVIEELRKAVYCAFLACFAQGLNLLARANKEENWGIKLSEVIRVWRNGCIIRSDYIADLLQPTYAAEEGLQNLLTAEKVIDEIKRTFPALKRITMLGIEWDAHM
jgi:6-phosphogluconate dehydrogenase